MGGKSSSRTSSNQSQTTTNSQEINTSTLGLDNVETGVVGDNNQVTRISTDQGAVDAGRRLGEAALDTVGETTVKALGTVERGLDSALDYGSGITADALAFGRSALQAQSQSSTQTAGILAGAIDRAASATRTDSAVTMQSFIKYGAIAAAVIAAAYAYSRKR